MKTFIWEWKEFGFRNALVSRLMSLTKWVSGGKKIHLTYKK